MPLRPRWAVPVAAAAAVAVCAAIALGIWAATLSNKLDRRDAALARQQRVAAIVARPDARTVEFRRGKLVVTADGTAALIVRNLGSAPPGRTYEAWVSAGGSPEPAGVFVGGSDAALPLERRVQRGAGVLVTVEKAGGVDAPTTQPVLSVQS